MTRWVLGLLLAVLAGGCGGTSSSGSCAAIVEFGGATYQGVSDVPFVVGDEIGTATYPPCEDVDGVDQDDEAEPATAFAVRGQDPSDAIVVGGVLYARKGLDLLTRSPAVSRSA